MQYRYVAPLISLRSKWRLTGFSRRFTPKNPVRLHNPIGELPRWGAKNVLPLNLIALLIGGGFFIPTSSGVSGLWYNEGMQRLVISD